MCRLFGLHAGASAVSATFWLLDAPDSLAAQSHRNPDGAGIGVFTDGGRAEIDKAPIAAWDDADFAAGARRLTGTTFVAHVRHATTGAHTMANTHPFEQDGRLFAHNGVVQDLASLDARLAELDASGLVQGETDSERIFALITAEIRRSGTDVSAGIVAAITWIARHLPTYSVNFVLTTASDLWALRYPEGNELWLLDRAATTGAGEGLDIRTDRIHARSDELARAHSVAVASEQMDGEPNWRLLEPGELLHVDRDLHVTVTRTFTEPPRHQLTAADLDPATARAQQPTP